MTTYRTIASSETQPQAPVTSELLIALADNPTAIAEGSSGSPEVEVAWHELEVFTLGADGTTITLTTDISAYRAVRLIGGATNTAGVTVDVDVNIGGTFRTVATATESGGTGPQAVFIDLHVDNIDNNDSSDQRVATGLIGFNNAVTWDAGTTGTGSYVFGVSSSAGSATAIRIVASANFDVSQGDPIFRLYGIKRTQP